MMFTTLNSFPWVTSNSSILNLRHAFLLSRDAVQMFVKSGTVPEILTKEAIAKERVNKRYTQTHQNRQ
jgi:hypothetical protein